MSATSALLGMPALALMFAIGILFDVRAAAGIAAGAAFSLGCGIDKRALGSRWLMMGLTGAGMTIAAGAGTLLGPHPVAALIATAVLGGVCGAQARRDLDAWWGWLQVVIAFLLALHFPGSGGDAIGRAGLVATGAAGQIATVWALARLVELREPAPLPPSSTTWHDIGLHAARAAICIAAAAVAARAAGIAHAYWAPMTAMLILKPGLRDTGLRGVERIAGTIAGVALASLVLRLVPAASWTLAAIAVLAAGCAFGLQQARYALLTTAVTTSIVLMLALAGDPSAGAERDRVIATLLGGGIALAGAALAPRRLPWRRSADDRRLTPGSGERRRSAFGGRSAACDGQVAGVDLLGMRGVHAVRRARRDFQRAAADQPVLLQRHILVRQHLIVVPLKDQRRHGYGLKVGGPVGTSV